MYEIRLVGIFISFAELCNGKRQLYIAYFYAIPIAILIAASHCV